MTEESEDLEFWDGRGLVAFSRPKDPNEAIAVFVDGGGSQAYASITVEQLEEALRYAKREDLKGEA